MYFQQDCIEEGFYVVLITARTMNKIQRFKTLDEENNVTSLELIIG